MPCLDVRKVKTRYVMMIDWQVKSYNDLSLDELYSILKIRQEVFIIEQACNYLDADSHDFLATHLIARKHKQIIAYMRIVPAGELYDHVSFGRILVKKKFRNTGIGKDLVRRAINLFDPNQTVIISAQIYLTKFYQSFGFCVIGEEYLEDDIPHIKMIRNG